MDNCLRKLTGMPPAIISLPEKTVFRELKQGLRKYAQHL